MAFHSDFIRRNRFTRLIKETVPDDVIGIEDHRFVRLASNAVHGLSRRQTAVFFHVFVHRRKERTHGGPARQIFQVVIADEATVYTKMSLTYSYEPL